ncbi:peptide chain release factor 1 [Pseudokineococcus basanitobsidens]|uniref:Peptide chain release factor 1 n=1 Tax=Pseudokineococcus basanitobsidens TaxID=1926649 RepID=A0ABU8RII3_9ACTN
MRDVVAPLLEEHAALEQQLADPALHADAARARRVGRRYAELGAVVRAEAGWRAAADDVAAARALAVEDASFAEELPGLVEAEATAAERLRRLLVPRDPDDGRDVILEVRAGEGGEESALFAGDLLRMYLRYAERRGWRAEVLDSAPSDLGGVKEAALAVRGRGGEPGDGVYASLKFEGGVHRVQRVPVTESAGRIHTSAAGVLVLPEPEEVDEVEVDPADLRVDVYRSSGPGGQSVNTTDSAVRLTHLPTGLVVSCQNEKSQLQNKEQALRILRARLRALAADEAAQAASGARRAQVRTVDRSERIRTYNFPENRVSDHRTGFKSHTLDAVLDGDLDAVVASCVQADEDERLQAAETSRG